jgi:hypothetical protein
MKQAHGEFPLIAGWMVFFVIPALILAGMIALSLPAWQCVRRRNQEQAGDPVGRPMGNAVFRQPGRLQ